MTSDELGYNTPDDEGGQEELPPLPKRPVCVRPKKRARHKLKVVFEADQALAASVEEIWRSIDNYISHDGDWPDSRNWTGQC